MSGSDEFPAYAVHYDYRVDILRRRNRVTATLDGVEIAASERTLLVDEQDHGLVFYFPVRDVHLDRLAEMPERSSTCPWKGTARYWRSAQGAEPIAWAYPEPKPEVATIRDHIAFYQNKVTVSVGTAPYLPPRPGAQKQQGGRTP